MMKEQVFAQALLLAGEVDSRQQELLWVLCGVWTEALAARLKADMETEGCREAFVMAASLYALADWKLAEDSAGVEEFRAGDLTVRKGSSGEASAAVLQRQAALLIGPYVKDGFVFRGV